MNMPIGGWTTYVMPRPHNMQMMKVGKRFNAQSNCSKERKVGPLYVKRERKQNEGESR